MRRAFSDPFTKQQNLNAEPENWVVLCNMSVWSSVQFFLKTYEMCCIIGTENTGTILSELTVIGNRTYTCPDDTVKGQG